MHEIEISYRIQGQKYVIYIDALDTFKIFYNVPPTERKTLTGNKFLKKFPKIAKLYSSKNKLVAVDYNAVVLIEDEDIFNKLCTLKTVSKQDIKSGSYKSIAYIAIATDDEEALEEVYNTFGEKVVAVRCCDTDTLRYFSEEFSVSGFGKSTVKGSYSKSETSIKMLLKIQLLDVELTIVDLLCIIDDVLCDGKDSYRISSSYGSGILLETSNMEHVEKLQVLKLYGLSRTNLSITANIPLLYIGNELPLTQHLKGATLIKY